jgi:glutathione synthase/RimK-type ligase-like ATP-grasp enzyme
MSDFCLDDGPATNKDGTKAPSLQVTADEVRPIVNVLKNAFGLEMFGFDVLQGEDGEYLVVDVNYFPSYKEVKDFPFLLAQYLTQRVLEQRRKKREAEMSGNVRKAAIAGM